MTARNRNRRGTAPAKGDVADKRGTLHHRIRPSGLSDDEISARMAVRGVVHNAVATVQFSQSPLGELALTESLEALDSAINAVHGGDLRDSEALLKAQAVALNAIFANLALRAQVSVGEYLDAAERYMRLALKARGQCRATLETLAVIKNPPVFARQANIANGPQQVNNQNAMIHAEPLRVEISENAPNKLLGLTDAWLDGSAKGKTGTGDPTMAAVGEIDGAANGRR
jgi:hypothetical protein